MNQTLIHNHYCTNFYLHVYISKDWKNTTWEYNVWVSIIVPYTVFCILPFHRHLRKVAILHMYSLKLVCYNIVRVSHHYNVDTIHCTKVEMLWLIVNDAALCSCLWGEYVSHTDWEWDGHISIFIVVIYLPISREIPRDSFRDRTSFLNSPTSLCT